MPGSTIAEHFSFIRGLLARPGNVGAVVPSGPALARTIAAQVDPSRSGPVLELGPGTGAVTEALIERGIAEGQLIAIEYDKEFAELMTKRFPRAHIIQGDAFRFSQALGSGANFSFAAIVSGLPLLLHPIERRRALIESALDHLQPGAPFVQFSYSMQPAIPRTDRYTIKRAGRIWMNIPPATVWVYRRV